MEDFAKEVGLPSNWEPITQAPVRPDRLGGAPPVPNGMANYFQGSISPTMQHDAVFVGTEYGSPSVPTIALMPIGASGVGGINSAIQSWVGNAISSITPKTPPVNPAVGQFFEVNSDGIFSLMYQVNGVIL